MRSGGWSGGRNRRQDRETYGAIRRTRIGAKAPRSRVNCGRLDMRIARDGTWFYHGTPIGRKEMVRLFATILERRAGRQLWLASPAEEGIIEVEDAPFLAVELFADGLRPRPARSRSAPMSTIWCRSTPRTRCASQTGRCCGAR